ncbi:MAG: hypothetical protein JST86_01900 [Bacteroidetes bacterium]|nr:hypothetical protein [Bacteroidota bacterium]
MGVSAPVNGLPVTAKVGMESSGSFSSGYVLNGPKQEFQIQMAYDGKTKSFVQIKMPTNKELDAGVSKLNDAKSFPDDGFLGGDNELYVEVQSKKN